MADICFNTAKGRLAYYASLPAANDALILILLEATGLEADSVLRDYADLATLLAASNNEQTTAGRKTLTSATATTDNPNDRVNCDFADQTWTALTGNGIGALLVCYDPDTTAGTDSTVVPLTKHDLTVTPDGTDLVVTVADFARCS